MSACCSGACATIEDEFTARVATRDLHRYRKRGPAATTRLLRDGVTAAGGPGDTLLDIGAGVGPLTWELLERGVRKAVSVDASAAYVAAGREEAARRNRVAQAEWRHGDFVALADSLAPADTVTLDRVVCCYPEVEPLVARAAGHARRRLALSYPRDVWYVRFTLAVENAIRAVRGEAFRTFLHPPRAIEQLVQGCGFALSVRRRTWAWCADVYVRNANRP
jgi:magnesium-protoporphyrin O-methyltransferase